MLLELRFCCNQNCIDDYYNLSQSRSTMTCSRHARLSRWSLVAYSAPALPIAAFATPLSFYLPPLLRHPDGAGPDHAHGVPPGLGSGTVHRVPRAIAHPGRREFAHLSAMPTVLPIPARMQIHQLELRSAVSVEKLDDRLSAHGVEHHARYGTNVLVPMLLSTVGI